MRPLPFIAVLLLLLCGGGRVFATHYKLFVLTGQSNSLGVTNGGEADPSIGSDPADADIIYFWENVVNATTSLGDSGGVFTTLQETQGGFYSGSATHWGPEIECARSLYRAGMRDFGFIKASRGGGGNTLWSKLEGGHMYSHVVDTVTDATAALTAAGDSYEIIALLYLQGESDDSTEAGIADTRFSELLTNLRAEPPFPASMQGIIGGIAAAGGNRDVVRAKQAALAAGDPTIHYFENLDQQPRLHDSLHFNKAAKMTVGERFAGAVMDAGIFTPSYGDLVFVGDSITQGGAGQPSYRYEVFKHLVDRAASYTFVGSVSGAYALEDVSASTPNYGGQTFSNMHDGHWGWRAFWENGRVPLPASRRSNNRGEGTILNWTAQASPQQYELGSAGSFVAYPDPAAAGTGNTGTTYTPDTAVVMIGINDLADGTSPTQVRDDMATMIDQLRGADASVRIHLCKVLHTDQTTPGLQANVDTLNDLLPALAATKNAALSTSPVWIADPSSGFDPVSLTHDQVHPNTAGEAYVGERIAASLGLVEMPPLPAPSASPPPRIEKASTSFPSCFEGDAIYDGTNFINGWAEVTAAATTEVLVGDLTDLQRVHINGAGAWLEGTASGWNAGNDGSWTLEARIKVNDSPSGFAFWLGTDSDLIFVEVHNDRTSTYSDRFNVAHSNNDGAFHVFRIAHDAPNKRYHVWRDGERLSAPDGAPFDTGADDNRLIIGDSTGGSFGDLYDIVIDSVCYDQTGAYLPPGADADGDGMPDYWEYLYFGDIVAAAPGDDADGDLRTNLEEFNADTDPTNRSSKLEVESISGDPEATVTVVVPDTSPQRLYTLMESTDLGTIDAWESVGVSKIGNDASLFFNHDPSDERWFYKVDVSMP